MAQAMKRGAPRRPDEYYAELLAVDPATEVLGAFVDEELVGFAVFFDLPDTMSVTGRSSRGYLRPARVPQPRHRSQVRRGTEGRGQSRGWDRLRWVVPPPVDAAATGLPTDSALYEEIATPSVSKLYDIVIDPLSRKS